MIVLHLNNVFLNMRLKIQRGNAMETKALDEMDSTFISSKLVWRS